MNQIGLNENKRKDEKKKKKTQINNGRGKIVYQRRLLVVS